MAGACLPWQFVSVRARVRSTGIVFTQAFAYINDWLGIGFIWTDPSESSRRDDYGMETFWRLQLTQNVQVTPFGTWTDFAEYSLDTGKRAKLAIDHFANPPPKRVGYIVSPHHASLSARYLAIRAESLPCGGQVVDSL